MSSFQDSNYSFYPLQDDDQEITQFYQSQLPPSNPSISQTIILFSILGVLVIYYLFLLYLHYSRGGLFPISERSFKLSMLSGICSMLYVINIILSCWLNLQNNIVTAPNLKQYCGFDRYPISDRSLNTYERNLLIAMQFFNNFLKIMEILTYLARTMRISYIYQYNLIRIALHESQLHPETSIPDTTQAATMEQQQQQQQQQSTLIGPQMQDFGSNNNRDNNGQDRMARDNEIVGNDGRLQQQQQQQRQNQRIVGVNVNQVTVQGSECSENVSTFLCNNHVNNHLGQQQHQQQQQLSQQQQERRFMEESLMYSVLSFSNEPQSVVIPETKVYWIYKHEYILICITFITAALISTIFIFEPSSSPFLFWNIQFIDTSSSYAYLSTVDNYIYIFVNFSIILSLLLCLHLIKGTEDNYKLKGELYLILVIFTVTNIALQFQCPTESEIDGNYEYVFGVFPLRLLLSGLLDFLAINVVLLRPIILATDERPWYSDQIVQDNIGYFCTKFRNFEDFLFSQEENYRNSYMSHSSDRQHDQTRKDGNNEKEKENKNNNNSNKGSNSQVSNQRNNNGNNSCSHSNAGSSSRVQSLVASNLVAILGLFLEMKSKEEPQIWMRNVARTLAEYSDLVNIFRHENIALEEIFEMDANGEKVIGLRETEDQQQLLQLSTSPQFLHLYRHAQTIILQYKKLFKMTPQYQLLQRRYQIQNFISLTFQEFGMTGSNDA